jgi:uncharacterized protein YcbK (DUF882 family)
MSMIARRHFMAGAGATVLSAPLFPALASMGDVRSLAFDNLHTGERLVTEYWAQGEYIPDALAQVNHVLRDFRSGEVHTIAPQLLDLLAMLHGRLETSAPFSVISGYRSPATNAMLRGENEHSGVASKSLHMQGMAIDIRVTGRPLAGLRDIALAAQAGGVGYYPASDFVHVDVGRVRRW